MPTLDVYEESFWVVKTPLGFFAQTLPEGATRSADAVTRHDAPIHEATRFAPEFARTVAQAGLLRGETWEAQPAAMRVETYPIADPDKQNFYTLATFTGEFLLFSKRPLDWPKVVEDAVRREELDSADSDDPWEAKDILPILDILREKHGVELVRSARYYHLGYRSEVVRPPGY